jgi:hypothetical protein
MSPVCRPWRGSLVMADEFSHPDRVGVGYGLPSLRDFQQGAFAHCLISAQWASLLMGLIECFFLVR